MLNHQYWLTRDQVTGVGVMAGTSFDGIDVAIVRFCRDDLELLHFAAFEYPQPLFTVLKKLCDNPAVHLEELTRCHWTLGAEFAKKINSAIKKAGVEADFIASHGQTIYHTPDFRPTDTLAFGGTLQLGEAAVIAERTGVLTLSDFRHADIAAGGEGAPLIPYFDYRYFSHPQHYRVFINIGGIANFTIVPPATAGEKIIAYDTGPGNMIIDAVCASLFSQPFDEAGKLAQEGCVDELLLAELLQDDYYRREMPKSTGREKFGVQYAENLMTTARERGVEPYDLLATVTCLTAKSIACAIKKERGKTSGLEYYLSGGGQHNRTLMNMLRSDLQSENIYEFSKLGIPGDAKEAVGFAALGYATLVGEPSNILPATGAKRRVLLGKINWPGALSEFRS